MFWRSVGVPQASPLEVRAAPGGPPDLQLSDVRAAQALLDRGDCTLEQLLAEEELIQELKSLNARVIDLCVPAALPQG